MVILGSAMADEEADQICSETPEPAVCSNCVDNDPHRTGDDILSLTHSVVFCMYSKAVDGHAHADRQSGNVREGDLKQALIACGQDLYGALNDLLDSYVALQTVPVDIEKARSELESGINYVKGCINAFRVHPNIRITAMLAQELNAAIQYYFVARSLFSMI